MSEVKIEQPTAEEKRQYDQFRLDHKDDKVGKIATNVLYEDERVRVWDMTLAPGENCDLHTHENDYYLIMLQGDEVVGISKDGTNDLVFHLEPGPHTFFIKKGATEWAVNTGKEPFYEILVEILE